MNLNFISKKYDISKSPIDNKFRVYEWMTLSDITKESERDCYKKWICIGVANDIKTCKSIIDERDKVNKE